MAEREVEGEVMLTTYQCDKCLLGTLQFKGMTKVQPQRAVHQCSNCKEVYHLVKQYPSVSFREKKLHENHGTDDEDSELIPTPV